MIKYYKKYEEIINYLIVGVLTTIVGILSYALFARVFNINYLVSSVMSWVLAVMFAFYANKLYVFKKIGTDIVKEIIEFTKYRLLSLFIDLALMYLFVSILKTDDLFAKTVVQVIIIVANYFFSKLFVFK